MNSRNIAQVIWNECVEARYVPTQDELETRVKELTQDEEFDFVAPNALRRIKGRVARFNRFIKEVASNDPDYVTIMEQLHNEEIGEN